MTGEIRTKTLSRALEVYYRSIDQNRILTVDEIRQALRCCRGTAKDYQRFLRKIFPEGPLDETRPVGDEQRCLM